MTGEEEDDIAVEDMIMIPKTTKKTRKRIVLVMMCVPSLLLVMLLAKSMFSGNGSNNHHNDSSGRSSDGSLIMEGDFDESLGNMPMEKPVAVSSEQHVPETTERKVVHDLCFLTAAYGDDLDDIDYPPDVSAMKEKYSPAVEFIMFTNQALAHASGWKRIIRRFPYERMATLRAWPKLMAWKEPTVRFGCKVVIASDNVHKIPKYDSMLDFLVFAEKLSADASQQGWAMNPSTTGNGMFTALDPRQIDRMGSSGKDATNTKEEFEATLSWLKGQEDFDWRCQMYDSSLIAYNVNHRPYFYISQFFWDQYREEKFIDEEGPLWSYTVQHFQGEPLSLDPIVNLFEIAPSDE